MELVEFYDFPNCCFEFSLRPFVEYLRSFSIVLGLVLHCLEIFSFFFLFYLGTNNFLSVSLPTLSREPKRPQGLLLSNKYSYFDKGLPWLFYICSLIWDWESISLGWHFYDYVHNTLGWLRIYSIWVFRCLKSCVQTSSIPHSVNLRIYLFILRDYVSILCSLKLL